MAVIIGFTSIHFLNKSDSPNGKTCDGLCVSIQNSGMNPAELAVKVGEFVQFNSADGKSHNLTTANPDAEDHDSIHGGSPTSISSGEFAADEAWRVRFKQPGTYKLRDTKNVNQEILVVVYEQMTN